MKRIVSIFLAAALLLSVFTVSVAAGGGILAADMTARDIFLYENTGGSWVNYDEYGNPLKSPWFRYDIPLNGLSIQDKLSGEYYPFSLVLDWWDVFYEDFTIIDGQSAETPWSLGAHEVTVWYEDVSATFTVTILPCPIKSFTVEPLTITEGTSFIFSHDYYDAEGGYYTYVDDEWMRYDYQGRLVYHVTLKNGETLTLSCYEIEDMFDEFPIVSDDQNYDAQWGVGTHYGTAKLFGMTQQVVINIAASPVDYIEALDLELIEGTSCYTSNDYYYDEDTGDFVEIEYPCYNYDPELIIHYKNGDAVPASWWDIIDEALCYDDQSSDNPWGLGTHTVEIEYMGCSDTFTVNIVESPVAYIEAEDVVLIEGADCHKDREYFYDYETGEDGSVQFQRYSYQPGLTVHYKDGTSEYLQPWMEYLEVIDDQSASNEWGRGTHTATVSYMGCKATFNVEIIETPVSRLEVAPFSVVEKSPDFGSYSDWDYDAQTSCSKYFYYYCNPEQITVYMKDGSKLSGDVDSVGEKTGYYCHSTSQQSYDHALKVGANTIEFNFMGVTATTTVNVVPHAQGCACAEFSDAPSVNNWAHEGLEYAVGCNLLNGDGKGHLQPSGTTTRAMLVQILYNMMGSPAVTYTAKFSDVKSSSWFAKAVIWAADNGIVSGTGNGKFDPNGTVTREQIAVILYNFVKSQFGQPFYTPLTITSFSDGSKVSSWAQPAMCWACSTGLITGKANKGQILLDPKGQATRAEVASILMRFHQNFYYDLFPPDWDD